MKKTLMFLASTVGAFALAGSPNDHFDCFATQFYGRLQVEVQRTGETTTVRVKGFDASRAAQSLGFKSDKVIETLEVAFPKADCNASADKLGVVACQIPDWQWPRPTLPVKALDREGNVVGQDVLSVYRFAMENTHRIGASANGDYEREQIELDAWLISETDNAKRATLHLPYVPGDCKSK